MKLEQVRTNLQGQLNQELAKRAVADEAIAGFRAALNGYDLAVKMGEEDYKDKQAAKEDNGDDVTDSE